MQNTPPGMRTRESIVVHDEGSEGLPIMGKERTQQLVDGELVDSTITHFTYCGGCSNVLHTPEEIGGICAICHRVLCKTCASIKCSKCGRSVCSADTSNVGDDIVCAECLATLARSGCGLLLLIMAAAFLILMLIRSL